VKRLLAVTSGRVLVVGSVNADLVVSVARLPGPGETVTGGRLARHGGGKSANQAVAAARLGAAVELVAAVGDDDLGAEALAELEREGVGVAGVARIAGTPTGVALIVVDEAGENQIAVASGANGELGREAVEAAVTGAGPAGGAAPGARPPAVVLLGLEVPDAAVRAGALAGAAAGARLVLNPAPARVLEDAVLDLGPVLTPNAAEALALTGAADPEAAARSLTERTGAPAIVTLGAEGALLAEPGAAAERIGAWAVEVVDTTGAGDAFNGALAAGLASGAPLADAVRLAVTAAGMSCRAAGARAGMPRREELRAAR
jgi:ribokinase